MKQYKTVQLPKEHYNYVGHLIYNMELPTNLTVGDVFRSHRPLMEQIPGNCEHNWYLYSEPGQTGYYHVSKYSCAHPYFTRTKCYCVKVVDGIITEITKHLPHKGEHK